MKSTRKKHLPIPPAAMRDSNSREMIRAWVAQKGLHCSLNVGMWHNDGRDEPGAWGILLADVVRHVANALKESKGLSKVETIEKIEESFIRELRRPTSPHKGKFVS